MPGAYRLVEHRSLALSRGWGVITDPELLALATTLAADPRFRADWSQLSDFRDVTKILVTGAGMREMAKASPFAAGARRAILVGTDEAYGLSRMFQAMRTRAEDEIEIFRDVATALDWLGIQGSIEDELAALAKAPPLR